MGERLGARDGHAQWERHLAEAGVLLDFDGDPRWDAGRAVRAALLDLERAEKELAAADLPLPERVAGIPLAAWYGLALLLAGLSSLFASFILGTLAALVVFAPMSVAGLAWVWRRHRQWRRGQAEAREARTRAALALAEAVARLTATDFVAQTGTTLVQCTPTRLRLERAARTSETARVQLRRLEALLAERRVLTREDLEGSAVAP